MEIYSLPDFEKILKDQGYKHIGLFDSNGKIIITFNNASKTGSDRFKEIEKRLAAAALPEGFYVIKCKNTTSKTVTTDDYTVKKGNPKTEEPVKPVTLQEPAPPSPSVISFSEALEMKTTINRLELENDKLLEESATREEYITELEGQLEEEPEPNTLKDAEKNVKTFIGQLTEALVPVLNTHYEQADRKLKLEELKYVNSLEVPKQIPASPRGEEQTEFSEEQQNGMWEELKKLAESDPEEYMRVMKEMQVRGEEQ